MLSTQIIILVILLFLSAFFSGIETALMSVSNIKVKALVKQKKKHAEILQRIKENPDKLIITILIGNNLVNIGAASLATVLFIQLFGSSGVGIATGVMTFLILVFGEITPKTLASQNAVKISLLIARPVEILSIILSPLIKFFAIISGFVTKILGGKEEAGISEAELSTTISMGLKAGILNQEAAEMMHNIMDFEGIKVTKIMTPEANIKLIDGDKKLKEALNYVIKTPFSRYPVYEKTKDNIIGVLDVDEVLKYIKKSLINIKIKKIIKTPFFVPETKEISSLLSEFQNKKIPMAIVVDEYGHLSGLITVEDILEEIVGDIFDKSERHSLFIKEKKGGSIEADAKTTIEDLNKTFKLDIEEKNFNTLAGFIEYKLQRIPKKGEEIKLKKIILKIKKVTKQGIKKVEIIKNRI